ncbi:MAG: hypothetical protein KDD61_12375 [Bdellovibrionales bacterium]|nr:hypothetical protein [Bdellovibrionales bacterium]
MNLKKWIASTICLTTVTFTAHANPQLEQRVLLKSERVQQLLHMHSKDLSNRELQAILQHLNSAVEIIRTGDVSPVRPGPRPHPGMGSFYTAQCHIDDDPDFTYDQKVVGELSGRRLVQLVDDCQALAEAAYGSKGSSGLKNLKVDMSKVPDYFQVAICEVDDDPDFTSGQMTVGSVAGSSVDELIEDCSSVASTMYGAKGSFGLSKLNDGRSVPRGNYKSAECWLDDDPDFTDGQIKAGMIWGTSARDLISQCDALAKATFKDKGSSGLKNLH